MIRLGNARFPLSAVSSGIMLTGGIGSGKSTAMRAILGQLMRYDCPMVIACVKPDEADQMEALARREFGPSTGSSGSVPASRSSICSIT